MVEDGLDAILAWHEGVKVSSLTLARSSLGFRVQGFELQGFQRRRVEF